MAIDKKTIGITKANSGTLGAIQIAGKFASELDAAKFSMAFAIKTGTEPGSADGAETKWNVGSVDPDGSLRSLLEGLFPSCAEPYRLAEYLMNEGIRQLGVAINERGDLYDTIFPVRQV